MIIGSVFLFFSSENLVKKKKKQHVFSINLWWKRIDKRMEINIRNIEKYGEHFWIIFIN